MDSCNNMRKIEKKVTRELLPEGRRVAEADIIHSDQQRFFQDEYKALIETKLIWIAKERTDKVESMLS